MNRFVLIPALAVTLLACGAKRDPVLEKQAYASLTTHEAQLAALAAAPTSTGTTPQDDPPETVKTYTDAEIDRIMSAIGGAGPTLWAEIRTQEGTIRCQLDEARAPQTVANFVGLAMGQLNWRRGPGAEPVRQPFYDGLTFHRAVDGFIIQAGNPGRRSGGGPGWSIPRETRASDLFEGQGALAMIDQGDNAHGSQFFITVGAAPKQVDKYAAFGTCEGAETISKISKGEKLPKLERETVASRPKAPVKIFNVKIARGAGGR